MGIYDETEVRAHIHEMLASHTASWLTNTHASRFVDPRKLTILDQPLTEISPQLIPAILLPQEQ
jgi:hypothetical protein